MPIYYWWLIIGVILIIGEMFTTDFSLACIGLAFMATWLPAYLGASFLIQSIFFAVVALILFFTVRPFALKYLHRSDGKTKTNVDALIGRKGLVTEAINAEKNTGRVQIDGDFWKAVAAHDIAAGAEVKVEKIEGIILTVKGEDK
ncbi:MAG: NfeD family protein [Elusimicrobium sp.]|jgi:membrane protein implicated in regulation of membrane protease activity|nr:NfeD family protein [Elusimicrobium sp.]